MPQTPDLRLGFFACISVIIGISNPPHVTTTCGARACTVNEQSRGTVLPGGQTQMRISHNFAWSKEFCRRNLPTLGLTVVSTVLCLPHVLTAQHAKPSEQKEQSEFGIELKAMPIQRPVTLPQAALNALSKDERVASCLENESLSPKELPANWFVASEIHLDGANESDLVVLPSVRLPGTPEGEISTNSCLSGANTAQMWVLRKTQPGFKLVLSQIGLGMSVLATRTNGLRDIEVGAAVGGYIDSVDNKFDGDSYKIADRTSNLIGAELPNSLSTFRTREMLVQLPDQSSEAVRAQARAWLWQQWEEHKLSYLTLKTHDETTDETSSYFIAPDENGKWQVTIQVRRIIRDDNATASQHRITEKKLLVAAIVERVELTTESMHAPRVISGDEILPESKYRLKFLDYAGRTAATL